MGARGVARIVGGAALSVCVGVAVNQILSDGKFSWTWLYASLGVSVLFLLYAEAFAAPDAANAPQTVRGGRKVYLRQLRASVQDMETVGVATPGQFVLRMRQVYVDVSLVPQALHTTTGEPFLGAVAVAEPAPGPGERRSLESVLRDAERETVARVLAVVGGPGSGKTTLARNTALSLCRRHWALRRLGLPVLIYLRDHAAAILAEDAPALGEVAVSVGWLEGKVSATWMERQLDRGGCVVLLDGLDEVADTADRGRVVSWTRRQIQRHPHNTYVVTSRPHGYESNPLPGAEVLQVRRFTAEQVSRFMHQWSHATERRAREGSEQDVRAVAHRNAENLLARLREKPALYDLAANPLLLTMTANVHRYRGQLPGSRAELYAEMCDVLLHRRSEDRGLHDATGLGGPHKQHVVQHLALAMMKARTRDWPLHDAVEAIRYPLQQVPGNVPPEVFLEEARKSGLLVEREHGVYGFAHLTLQEYLAAAQLGTPSQTPACSPRTSTTRGGARPSCCGQQATTPPTSSTPACNWTLLPPWPWPSTAPNKPELSTLTPEAASKPCWNQPPQARITTPNAADCSTVSRPPASCGRRSLSATVPRSVHAPFRTRCTTCLSRTNGLKADATPTDRISDPWVRAIPRRACTPRMQSASSPG